MEYLVQPNKAVAGDQVPNQITAEGKHVIVLGGGDTGADCIGTAHRQGALSVTNLAIGMQPPAIAPRAPAVADGPDRVRGLQPRTKRAASAMYLASTVEFLANERRRGARAARGRDRVRRRPARAQDRHRARDPRGPRPARAGLHRPGAHARSRTARTAVRPAAATSSATTDYETSVSGVFVAGDAGRGQSLIVWAIAEGRAAAAHVDAFLMGETALPVAGPPHRSSPSGSSPRRLATPFRLTASRLHPQPPTDSEHTRMRRAKIVATLGPATSTYEMVRAIIDAGVDVARMNLSHGDYSVHEANFANVRRAADDAGRPVAVLVDLQGPKIRLGKFDDGPHDLAVGDIFKITTEDILGTKEIVSTTFKGLPDDVNPGDSLLIDDGKVRVEVIEVEGSVVTTKVIVAGPVSNNKGINLPGVAVNVPALSEKDEADLRWGLRIGADLIALSFVRSAKDVAARARHHGRGGAPRPRHRQDREAAGRRQPRGDHRRVRRHHGRPRRPRRRAAARGRADRAEARRRALPPHGEAGHRRDADARVDDRQPGPDARRDQRRRQRGARRRGRGHALGRDERRQVPGRRRSRRWRGSSPRPRTTASSASRSSTTKPRTQGGAITLAAMEVAEFVEAKYLCIFTESGDTARRMSRLRPNIPMIGFTPEPAIRRRMALTWGIQSTLVEHVAHTDRMFIQVDDYFLSNDLAEVGDKVVVISGSPPGIIGSTNDIRIHKIGDAVHGKAPIYKLDQ